MGRWLSLNEEIFEKEKRKALRTMANSLDMAYIWIKLIELARETNDNGFIYINKNTPYTIKTLSSKLKLSEELIENSLKKMIELSIIEIKDNGIIKCIKWRGSNPYTFIDDVK